LKNGWVINCGAVGKHINGAGVAQYALLTVRDGKIKADIREVAYPREQLVRAAMERNFPLEEGSVISIQAGELDSAERLRESVISAELSLLRSLIKIFQASEAELDAENVRHLRIAARRLLHALRTFSAYFPRRLLHLRRLKELRLIAGQLRELDVLMEFLGSCPSQLKENQAGGLPLLRNEVAARREESQRKLKQQLVEFHRNRIFQSLQSAITYEARSKPRKENGVDPSLGMRTNFHRLIKRMVREVVNFLDRARNPLRRDEFHQLRIACKKLRYTLEFFDSVSSQDNQAKVDTLQQFQRLMGKIHDLDSSTALLEALRESLKRRLDAADALATVDYCCVAFQRDRMELFGNFLETLHDFENSRFFDSLVPDGGR
jgi:CHAD domain-containing protein